MKAPNFRTLDLNLLRVFDQVMAERNLTRAARNLSMTQPAVSNALNRLRDALGDRLVARSGYGVEPTPRALALWPSVAEALRQLETSIAPNTFVAAEANSSFTLAMADSTAAEVVPGLMRILEREAPGISVRMMPLTTRDPRPLLDDGTADLAVGYFPAVLADLTAQEQGGSIVAFAHERLYDGVYVCVMRQGHELEQQAMSLDAFCAARHMLVSFSGQPYGFIDEALASLGRQRRVVLTVNQFFTAARVVETSDLLSVLPRHFIRVSGREQVLVQRPLPFMVPPVHVDALWHRRQAQRPDHSWLRQAVAQAARKGFGDGTR